MKEVFTKGILQYNLRICRATLLANPKSKKDSIDTVAYKTAQLWSMLPARYKNLSFIQIRNKKLAFSEGSYNICQIFVGRVGFIN